MKKRLISWILTFCLVLALMPVHGTAATGITDDLTEKSIHIQASGESILLADVGDQMFSEAEPNDIPEEANVIGHDYTVSGQISGDDLD